jgi:hypothetical protein
VNDDELFDQAARAAHSDGIDPSSTEPDGPMARWVQRNVKHRPETLFFIVFILCCRVAEMRGT